MLVAVAAALTLVLACRTLWYLFHSVTNVPYADQWVMLDEIRQVREGQSGWSYLWSTYWGQRLFLPRLLFLFSAKYLHYSMLSFVLINVAVQATLVAGLVRVIRKLFSYSSLVFWIAAIASVHLLFSSLQMEIFVEGIAVQYTIGYASAVAAICVLGATIDPEVRFERRFWIAILFSIAATACLAIGPLVWPILIVEASLSSGRKKHHLAILVLLTILVVSAYSVGYTRPDIGMGFFGIIRHPIAGIRIIAMVLGGPISLYSRSLGMFAGGGGMILFCGILIYFSRKRSANAAAISLMMVACFMIGSALSIAIGRLSPEWLANYSDQPLPSRYLAPTFIFWAALFAASFTCWRSGSLGRVAICFVSIIVFIMTFGTSSWQWRMPPAWASISQGFDAIASGFIVSASDQEFMSRVFPVEDYRNRLVSYMRREHLTVFAEERAGWIGQDIATIARMSYERDCRGTITTNLSLGGRPAASRIIGTLTVDGRPPRELLDILITDGGRRIIGLARTLPAQSEGKRVTGFFGYMLNREAGAEWTSHVFVLFPDRRLCAVLTR